MADNKKNKRNLTPGETGERDLEAIKGRLKAQSEATYRNGGLGGLQIGLASAPKEGPLQADYHPRRYLD